jgi:predicted permease
MDPGFNRDRVVTFTVDPSLHHYSPEQSRALSKKLLDQVRILPGVAGSGIASRPLMRGTGLKGTFAPAGSHIAPADFLNSSLNAVTPDYFDALQIPLLAGRRFSWSDRSQVLPRKVLVNQTFARRFFPGRNPIGERFGSPGPNGVARAENEIVGVVGDAKYRSLREPVPATVYSPAVDGFDSDFILYVRARQRPQTLIALVRATLRALDPELPFVEVHTLQDEVEASLWQERLLAWPSSFFGVMAAMLAGIGLYGLLHSAVASSTREIGIRLALGADPPRIAALFSRYTLLLTAAGIALGMCSYFVAASGLRAVLYNVHPWDPAAIAGVIAFTTVVGALAAAPAIWQAVRIDPASALRTE